MKKLFEIRPVKNEKRKKIYPYKIKLSDGLVIPLPSQYDFDNSYIRSKGCIIAAFYMGLRFVGVKKSMAQCLKYLTKVIAKTIIWRLSAKQSNGWRRTPRQNFTKKSQRRK